MKTKITILIFMLALFSCEKKPYPVVNDPEQPIYFANGKMNNTAFSLQDGVNDVVQTTNTIITPNAAKYQYYSTLKTTNASSSEGQKNLTVQINGLPLAIGLPDMINQDLVLGDYDLNRFHAGPPDINLFNFQVNCDDPNSEFTWTFHNGSQIVNTLNWSFVENLTEDGYEVSALFSNEATISAEMAYLIDSPLSTSEIPPIYFNFERQINNTYVIHLMNNNSQKFNINSVNYNNLEMSNTAFIPAFLIESGFIKVRVTNQDTQEQITCVFTMQVTGIIQNSFSIGNITKIETTSGETHPFHSVQINYIFNNKTYSSFYDELSFPPNPLADKFTIDSIAEGELTLAGKKTKKVSATFNGTLYNQTNPLDSLEFENLKLNLAFEY